MPFIADLIPNESLYKVRQLELREYILSWLTQQGLPGFTVALNPQDVHGKPYLVSLGSAADTGDVGVVGRGNRLNGLITPMRSMSIEAANGKNPIDHTGKLYGELARLIADEISATTRMSTEVHLITFKSRPIEDPDSVMIYIDGRVTNSVDRSIRQIVNRNIAVCGDLTDKFINEGVTMF